MFEEIRKKAVQISGKYRRNNFKRVKVLYLTVKN